MLPTDPNRLFIRRVPPVKVGPEIVIFPSALSRRLIVPDVVVPAVVIKAVELPPQHMEVS